jgi:hypothetical protein
MAVMPTLQPDFCELPADLATGAPFLPRWLHESVGFREPGRSFQGWISDVVLEAGERAPLVRLPGGILLPRLCEPRVPGSRLEALLSAAEAADRRVPPLGAPAKVSTSLMTAYLHDVEGEKDVSIAAAGGCDVSTVYRRQAEGRLEGWKAGAWPWAAWSPGEEFPRDKWWTRDQYSWPIYKWHGYSLCLLIGG